MEPLVCYEWTSTGRELESWEEELFSAYAGQIGHAQIGNFEARKIYLSNKKVSNDGSNVGILEIRREGKELRLELKPKLGKKDNLLELQRQ